MAMKVHLPRDVKAKSSAPVYNTAVFFEVPTSKSSIYYLTAPLPHYNAEQDNQELQQVSGRRKRCAIVVDNMLAHDSAAIVKYSSMLLTQWLDLGSHRPVLQLC